MVRAAVALSACSLCVTVACSALVGTDGLSRDGDGDGADGDAGGGGSSGTSTTRPPGTGGGADGGDAASEGPAPPGRIDCAGSPLTCEVSVSQCCVTIVGEASEAVRRVDTSHARCMAPNGANCGAFSSAGSSFTSTIVQACARKADCGGAAPACCALPLIGNDRYTKTVGRITCSETSACQTGGRILCASQADCPATMTCTPETDPILSLLYGSFCL